MTETVDIAALSGIDQLRLGMTGGFIAPIARTVGFELTEVEEGRVVFEAIPTTAVYNPLGTVHGGWIATVLDSACGCVVHSTLRPGQTYTTLELKVNYIRAVQTDDGELTGVGEIIHVGGRTATAEGKVFSSDGKLVAHGSTTCIVFR